MIVSHASAGSTPPSPGALNVEFRLFLYKSVRVVCFREDSPLELDSPSLWWANRAENVRSQIVTSAAIDSMMGPPVMFQGATQLELSPPTSFMKKQTDVSGRSPRAGRLSQGLARFSPTVPLHR